MAKIKAYDISALKMRDFLMYVSLNKYYWKVHMITNNKDDWLLISGTYINNQIIMLIK